MQENPYAPPLSNLVDQKSTAIVLASRWKRFWAASLDGVISMLIITPIMYFTGGFQSISGGQKNPFLYTVSIGLVGILIFVLIHGRLLSQYGQTVGKRILGIRIADLEGNVPSIKRHILPRYAFTSLMPYIPILGAWLSLIDLLLIFGKSKRCVHDRVGKTIVINK